MSLLIADLHLVNFLAYTPGKPTWQWTKEQIEDVFPVEKR